MDATILVYRLLNPLGFVAFKMGRRQGGEEGRISKSIRNRRATRPPAHFQRNPPGRGHLAVFRRCSLLTYQSRYARRSRLEKQPNGRRRNQRDLGDGTLVHRVISREYPHFDRNESMLFRRQYTKFSSHERSVPFQ